MGFFGFVVLVLVIVALMPSWPYSRRWGYRPTGILGTLLLIWLLLLLFSVIPWWGYPGYY